MRQMPAVFPGAVALKNHGLALGRCKLMMNLPLHASLIVACASLPCVPSLAQQTELFQVEPPQIPGIAEEVFGGAIALSGEWVFVADPTARDASGTGAFGGAVYIYRRVGPSWQLSQHLTGDSSSRFGSALAVDGTTLAVSSRDWDATGDVSNDTGKVSIYELQGGSWGLSQELLPVPPTCTENTFFGWTLALSGDVLAVGMRDCDFTYFRQVRVYERSGGPWVHVQTLKTRSDTLPGSIGVGLYARALAADGDLIVAGALDAVGSAVVYRRDSAGRWFRSAWLTHPQALQDDWLGSSVAIDGETIVVGAPVLGRGANGVTEGGYAVVYERMGLDQWTQVQRLEPSDPFMSTSTSPGGQFGYCVAIERDTIAAGATDAATAGFRTGTVYYFEKGPSGWPSNETERFVASNATRGDDLGAMVAIDDDVVVATAFDLGANGGFGRRILEFRRRFGGSFCDAMVNLGALSTHGSDVAAANGTEFFVTNLPPSSVGGLAASLTRTAERPVFSGNLCLGPAVRLVGPMLQADAEGRVYAALDATVLGGAWSPGSTIHFQYWFEDSTTPGVGFSNAIELLLR